MLSLENKLAPCAGKTVNPLNIVGQYIMSPFHLPAFYYKKKKKQPRQQYLFNLGFKTMCRTKWSTYIYQQLRGRIRAYKFLIWAENNVPHKVNTRLIWPMVLLFQIC
jgi:hypothetical protein